MSESNALLADQFGRHDDRAFAKLMQRHYSLVFELCLRMLGHRQDAEDATQETFTRLASHLAQWDRRRPLEPWLATIAGNRCRTLLAKRRPHQSLATTLEPATTATIQQRDAQWLAEEVHRALDQLPIKQQTAFRMFHEQSMEYAEIAIALNRPLGTIKTWVHRTRMHLIDELGQREVVEVRSHRTGANK